jgi:hypothetical protein
LDFTPLFQLLGSVHFGGTDKQFEPGSVSKPSSITDDEPESVAVPPDDGTLKVAIAGFSEKFFEQHPAEYGICSYMLNTYY